MKFKGLLSVFAVILIAMGLCSCKSADPPVTYPATDPITEPVTEPVTDPVTEPVTDPVTEPVTDPVTDPVTEPVPEPVSSSHIPQVFITASDEINRDGYVPCTVKVYDPGGVYSDIYDTDSEIKIRGNSTSSGAKSPWNIKFSSKIELLGLGKGKKWSLLSNMYDKTQFRNKLAYDFALAVGISYTSSSTFAEVYLNGEYQGFYQICEPVDVSKTQVDIDTDKNEYLLEIEPYLGYAGTHSIIGEKTGIILTFNEPEEPDAAQLQWVSIFISSVEDALLSGDYETVKQYVDVDSFAQCYIVQELFKNVDYSTSSTRFYIKGGKLYEGPVWDFDLSSGNCSSSYYPAYNNVNTSGLSYEGIYCVSLFNKYLFNYDEFKTTVASLYSELQPQIVNLYEDNELGRSKLDTLIELYSEEIARNNGIWSTAVAYNVYEHLPVDGTYEGEIKYLRDWLKNRNEFIYNHYCADNNE